MQGPCNDNAGHGGVHVPNQINPFQMASGAGFGADFRAKKPIGLPYTQAEVDDPRAGSDGGDRGPAERRRALRQGTPLPPGRRRLRAVPPLLHRAQPTAQGGDSPLG